ncbi:hypothetical protein PGB28_00040 [Primorskyibacter aestuariivivens]|uniref:hypothetical protein n=1 Tax=Primorskyibacter aestuariivivens TaxID=1888912 RepID=UPI002300AA3A|nr:hypothetical protein [Primorskyibacter aestuariivivens]MDA7426827.1 hypothetical protein [Primorskyibacter aestuariivivens]
MLFLNGDEASGGTGADTFNVLADEVDFDAPVITDYNGAEDQIAICLPAGFDLSTDVSVVPSTAPEAAADDVDIVQGTGEDAIVVATVSRAPAAPRARRAV